MASIALFLHRVGFGLLLALGYGWPKVARFAELDWGLRLAIVPEFFCALAVVLGWRTRLASWVILLSMTYAYFWVHAEGEWPARELTLLYLLPFVVPALMGAGRFSLDRR